MPIHYNVLNSLGIHLSIAKMYGSRSLSYFTVKPKLRDMNKLARIILRDLQTQPISWIDQFRQQKYQLIESFYLTVTDKEKVSGNSILLLFLQNPSKRK